jgi:acyl CoA:acetate/3-ketoacid CoA transferase alpha subunit
MNKVLNDPAKALEGVQSGMTILLGGVWLVWHSRKPNFCT